MKKGPRPFHVAEASWSQISMELRTTVFNRPEPKPEPTHAEKLAKLALESISVKEEVTRVTTVSAKWRFKS